MTRIAHALALPLAAAALTWLAACRPPRVPPEDFAGEPIRTASPEELLRSLRDDAAAVVGLRGAVTLGLQARGRDGVRTCRGALAARTPWVEGAEGGLYVKGYRSLAPTLFTLVSDGRRFWLHVPSENVVYVGPIAGGRAAQAGRDVPVDARDLFRGLFVQPPPPDARVEVGEDGAAYLVSVRREGRLERRLWVERRRFAVRREIYYGPGGEEELAIERDRYVDAGGRIYPGRIALRDRARGGAVLLEFERVAVNPADLDARAFRPRVPPGARTLALSAEEDRE